jgi:hypothetical protein
MIPDIRRSMVWKQINPLEPGAFSKSNLMQQDTSKNLVISAMI